MKKLSFFLMAMLMSVMSFAAEATATISFANKAQRTVYTTSQQVWEQNGIVVTNDKASSTTNVGDYANPARFYKGSKVTIQCTLGNIKKIEITGWGDSKYNVWVASIGSEATASGSSVIITPTATSDTYVANMTTGQGRAGQMVVTYEVSDEGFVSTPAIEGEQYFKESATVSMKAAEGLKVYYTLDGTEPTTASTEYAAPFEVTETTTVKAIAHDGENASEVVTVVFKKMEVLTPSEAVAITPTGDKYIVRGYVTSSNEYSTQYNNIDFFVADTKDGGEVLKVYRAVAVTEEDKAVKVGDYVEVIGVLAAYYETIQIAQGGTYTIIPEPEPEYEITPITMTNLNIGEMGNGLLVLSASDDANTGLNVMLLLNADGSLNLEQSYLAIVVGWNETALTLVEGSLTKSYDEELGTDVYKGLLVVDNDGTLMGLDLTMYYLAPEPIVVVVENANINDDVENSGFMYMTGEWTSEDGTLYPINVEVPGYDATLTETVYNNVSVHVGSWESVLLAYVQGSVNAVAADGVLTLKGVLSGYDGSVVDLTISGKLPVVEPAGVTYNVTVPEGTYACYIAGEMNEWTHQEMSKVDDTHYTITIEGATTAMKYKYCSGPEWKYVEKDANGNDVLDRTYAENDVVASWAAIYNPNPTVEPETTWTVAGSVIFGSEWTPADAANDMTLQNDGTYKWEKIGLELAANTKIEFKVVKNHAWGEEYPSSNYVLTIAEDGIYTVTITFNPSTKEVVALVTKTGDADVEVEISYVLMGVQGNWETGIALTQNPENANEYILLGQEILKGDAVKVVTLTNGKKTAYCGNVEEWTQVAYGFDADGNIVLKPGKYDFYYKVDGDIIYIGGEAYPEVIAYELDGGELPTVTVPTQEELWTSFKTATGIDTKALAELAAPVLNTIGGLLKGTTWYEGFDVLEWQWLKNYIQSVQAAQAGQQFVDANGTTRTVPALKDDIASDDNWRFAVAAFFAQSQYVGWPAASADFTEAGKPEVWGAAYEAEYGVVLPTEPVAEDYVLPTPTKEGYKFVGWYDNAAGEGDAYEVIPAGWSGTLYAIWEQDTTTALENIAVEGKAVKAIINGQLIIIKNGVQYNAQGQVVK